MLSLKVTLRRTSHKNTQINERSWAVVGNLQLEVNLHSPFLGYIMVWKWLEKTQINSAREVVETSNSKFLENCKSTCRICDLNLMTVEWPFYMVGFISNFYFFILRTGFKVILRSPIWSGFQIIFEIGYLYIWKSVYCSLSKFQNGEEQLQIKCENGNYSTSKKS